MNEPFDPYRKWLGIPPRDQPPNHYRLLGLQDFEADVEAIEHAAYQRMAYVRDFQAGEHAGEAVRILNEISLARICLLNATGKAAYDQSLRSSMRPPPPKPLTVEQVQEEMGDSTLPTLSIEVEEALAIDMPLTYGARVACPVCGCLQAFSPKLAGLLACCSGCRNAFRMPIVTAEPVDEPVDLPATTAAPVDPQRTTDRRKRRSRLVRFLCRVDEGLQTIAGPDNPLLYRFFRVLAVVLLVLLVALWTHVLYLLLWPGGP